MGRKRVYVAGAYSADNVMRMLNNMRIGLRESTQVFLGGYAPFCPWLDYQFQFMLQGDENLTVQDYYDYSMAWLEVSDIVLVNSNDWNDKSIGTQKEIERAHELGIPVVYSYEELSNYVW